MPQTPPSGTELEKLYSDIRRELDSIRNFTELISVRSPALDALSSTCFQLLSLRDAGLLVGLNELSDALYRIEHSLNVLLSEAGWHLRTIGKSPTT